MSNWKLGDRAQTTHRLNKQTWDPETFKKFKTSDNQIGQTEKRWVPVPFEQEVVIVGKRVIQNNWVDYNFDEAALAVPTKYITAYLVAYDMRKNPVYVLPGHMTRIP